MQPKTQKTLMWVGIGIAGFVVLAMVLTGPLIIQGIQQKKAVDRVFSEYSAALVKKDYPRGYDLSGPEFKAAASYEQFVGDQQVVESQLGVLTSIKQGQTYVHGHGTPMRWKATIYAEHVHQRGSTTFVYEFHYYDNDGQWRLYGFERK